MKNFDFRQTRAAESSPTFYLHIGMGKTGTSSIKAFLRDNYEALLKNRVLYVGRNFENVWPHFAKKFQSYDHQKNPENTLAMYLNQDAKMWAALWERCNAAQGAEKIIVSYESYFLSGAQMAHVLKGSFGSMPVKILVYLRRQDHWYESAYKQWGIIHKTYEGPVKEFDEWFESWKHAGLYYEKMLPWIEAFGKGNILLRTYEKDELEGGDAVKDFLSQLGICDWEPYQFPPKAYQTYNYDILQIVKAYQGLFTGRNQSITHVDLLRDFFEREEIVESSENQRILSPRKRLEILDKYSWTNQKLAQTIYGPERKDLFKEPPPDPEEPFSPPPALSQEAMARIFFRIAVLQRDKMVRLIHLMIFFYEWLVMIFENPVLRFIAQKIFRLKDPKILLRDIKRDPRNDKLTL